MKKLIIGCAILMFVISLLPAADPPERINYQGVLRDSSDKPISTTVAMKFRFYDDPVAGTLLWEEIYDAIVYPPAIAVSDGLFAVPLGDPAHRNAGSSLNFPDIFTKYTNVYLAIVIETDPEMTPRIKVISSAYSLNADNMDGIDSAQFLRSDTSDLFDSGTLAINAGATLDVDGTLRIDGIATKATTDLVGNFNSDFLDGLHSTAFAGSSHTHPGSDVTSIVSNSDMLDGNDSTYFLNTSSAAQTKTAKLTLISSDAGSFGVEARGPGGGGYFLDSDANGYAYVGYRGYGIHAQGNSAGGYFSDASESCIAYVGYGGYGIHARGSSAGGYFSDASESGYAYVGEGNRGISAYGNDMGGYFDNTTGSGYAYVGYGDHGIEAYGYHAGGYFGDSNSSGYAYVGYGDLGIDAHGNTAGGYFIDTNNSGYAYVGYADYGIYTLGNSMGGYFADGNNTGYAYVGYWDNGIESYGNSMGGSFMDLNSSGWGYVAYSSYKIYGSGTVSFVQNHPYNKDQVIVYSAPEGDEVATYTRGTARLVNGEAHVQLGETFKWVTNPDIGLTAHITPRGEWADLYVVSITPQELIVRSRSAEMNNAVFDYFIFGLRIGFEESNIVQPKKQESYIPSMKDHRDMCAQNPDLKQYNALERFKKIRSDTGLDAAPDFSASLALKNAVHEYDPATDPRVCELLGHGPCPEKISPRPAEQAESPVAPAPLPSEPSSRAAAALGDARIPVQSVVAGRTQQDTSAETEAISVNLFPVSEPVEIGHLLTLDLLNQGQFQKGRTAADRNVVGIVAAEPIMQDGQLKAALVESNFGIIKADASYGSILAGDLLVTSATPGHAMKAPEVHAEGTVIGKALEPLEAGTGMIKVLIMLR